MTRKVTTGITLAAILVSLAVLVPPQSQSSTGAAQSTRSRLDLSRDANRRVQPGEPNPQKKDIPAVPGELIVKFREESARIAAEQIESKHGVKVKKHLLLPNYSLISAPPEKEVSEVVKLLEQDPDVELVEPNGIYYLDHVDAVPVSLAPNDPYYSYQWNFPQIQMSEAWDVANGSGVTVAVLDSGVAYESYGIYAKATDLANTTFVPGWNFLYGTSHANDDNRHGTHVAGTIAQSTNNGVGVAGVAYGARIMPVKVCNYSGSCTWADVANGVRWAADNGAKVINLSLGGSSASSTLEDAVNYAYGRGVVVVASAGNDSYPDTCQPVSYPAAYARVIAVGATRYDQTRSKYSNCGSALDVVAPGGDLTVDQNGDGYGDGVLQQTFASGSYSSFGYYFLQGTSMAAPHVAGVAALILSASPGATVDQVRTAIQATAKDLGTRCWDQTYGWGLVQASSAVRYGINSQSTPNTTSLPYSANLPIVMKSYLGCN